MLLASGAYIIGEDENSGIVSVRESPGRSTFCKTELCPTKAGIKPVTVTLKG